MKEFLEELKEYDKDKNILGSDIKIRFEDFVICAETGEILHYEYIKKLIEICDKYNKKFQIEVEDDFILLFFMEAK